jgi:hypothetical protein
LSHSFDDALDGTESASCGNGCQGGRSHARNGAGAPTSHNYTAFPCSFIIISFLFHRIAFLFAAQPPPLASTSRARRLRENRRLFRPHSHPFDATLPDLALPFRSWDIDDQPWPQRRDLNVPFLFIPLASFHSYLHFPDIFLTSPSPAQH